ncbi:hydrogenase maturation protease [Methanolobus vulcani]|uniref:Hydrogenase maturation protease n=1 Tax=Methanolobus vulcani TaxID=38026 RepID=A0A7Z8P1F9_9EURY|nr:hydrogenase maturation protease [Methanolobus vulcani]
MRILGCGNPLRGDDGIGIHVVNRLSEMRDELPDNVELMDAGVGGLDILNMLEGVSDVIIVDAVKGIGDVGSVHRLSADDVKNAISKECISVHDISLADVLTIAEQVQEMPDRLTIFAVEIEKADEISVDLSEKVKDSLDTTVKLVFDEISAMKAC